MPQKLPLQNLKSCLEDDSDFFPHFKTNVSHDPLGQIRGQNQGQKVIASNRADSENFLTYMEFSGNFLQNDTKFVEIPLVVGKISQFEFYWVPPFFAKPQLLKRNISQLQPQFQ